MVVLERKTISVRLRFVGQHAFAHLPSPHPTSLSIREALERRLIESSTDNQLNEDFPMRVMVIVKASPESEEGQMPTEQLLSDMLKYNEQLVKAGDRKSVV